MKFSNALFLLGTLVFPSLVQAAGTAPLIQARELAPGAVVANLGFTPVFSNSGLSTLPSSVGMAVRQGFAVMGDSPPLTFAASGSVCSLNSGAGDGGSQVPSSDGKCWLAQFAGVAYASQFGVAAALADNAAAINAWLAVQSPAIKLAIAPGVYNFKSALAAAQCNGCTIEGVGTLATVFNYTGSSTNINLFSYGSAGTNSTGSVLKNIKVTSSTTMTAGSGILLYRLSDTTLYDLYASFEGVDSQTLYNGITFAGAHSVTMQGCSGYGTADAIQVYGVDGNSNSDLIMRSCWVYYSNNGIHVGGNFGGVYVPDGGAFGMVANDILIDTALSAAGNRELFFGEAFSGDGAAVNGITFNDTLTSNSHASIGGPISTNSGAGINVVSWPNGTIAITSPYIINAGNGVKVADATARVGIGAATQLYNNTMGVNCTVNTTNVQSFAQATINGTDYAANCNVGWQSYAPVVTPWATPSGFTYTSTGKTQRINQHTTMFIVNLTITAIGSATGGLHVTTPFYTTSNGSLSCVNRTTGYPLAGLVNTGTYFDVLSNGAMPGTTGTNISCTGWIDD